MKKYNFPLLMISEDGQLVLFLNEKKGVAMNSVCAEFGNTYDDWFFFNFIPFKEQLIISNKIIKDNE